MEKLCTVIKKEDQVLTGSDHELIAKFRLKLKIYRKATIRKIMSGYRERQKHDPQIGVF